LTRRRASAVALALTALTLGACGSSQPPSDAEITVYISSPDTPAGRQVVEQSRDALADAGGEAGGVAVRAVYLDAPPDPAAIAANARRAVEDSTSIAYIGELSEKGTLSSRPITDEAGLLQVAPTDDAMARVLDAIDGADDPLDRASVEDSFEPSER
jgi:branched-chain amino acid transport system substrate-binding protein